MKSWTCALLLGLAIEWHDASAQAEAILITFVEALDRAAQGSPQVAVARSKETVAEAEINVAGVYPNPTLLGGTSTQTAKFTGGAVVPFVVFGQRGAAMAASRADFGVVQVETQQRKVTFARVLERLSLHCGSPNGQPRRAPRPSAWRR